MGTIQGDTQAAVRAITGTAYSYEGDWHALFDVQGIAPGAFNGRLLAWMAQRGIPITEINGAMVALNALAIAGGSPVATADNTGLVYTAPSLKPGSTAVLFANGSQIATATVDGTGKATWTLGGKPTDGAIITFDGTVTGPGGTVSNPTAPTLAALTLSPATATVGTAYSGTISGATSGSSVSLSGAGAAGLSVSGTSVTGTPTASGAVNTVETLAGATNSPRTSSGVLSVAAAVTQVTRNAVGLFAPGHNAGTLTTSAGSAITNSQTFTNNSGAAISTISAAYIGWVLKIGTPGYTDVGNSYDVVTTIEYPVGTTVANTTTTVASGSVVETARTALGTAIPAGASFKVNSSITVASGLKVPDKNGLAGVLTTAMSNTLKKESIFAVGDSIMTNNNGFLALVGTRCPVSQMTIVNSKAGDYSADYSRQAALAKAIGATRVFSNFSVNDMSGGTVAETVRDRLLALQSAMTAQNILWTQTTQTPRSSAITVTPTAVSSSGTTITVTVPDTSLFEVGKAYKLSGATQTEYNQSSFAESIDSGAGTITLPFAGSGTTPPTGTITLGANSVNSRKLQTPDGTKAARATLNGYIRSGIFTGGYVEWADAFDVTRDEDIWPTGGDKPQLLGPATVTVQSVIFTNTRFTASAAPYSGLWGSGGFIIGVSGANRGIVRGNVATNGSDISASAFPNAISVGDTYRVFPYSDYATTDRVHPTAAIGSLGGQAILQAALNPWLDSVLN